MRVLIVRFSSFGDIFQALVVPEYLRREHGANTVAWLTRSDFADLLENQDAVDEVIAFDRRLSVGKLIALAWNLAGRFDGLYDAHANLRSLIVRTVFRMRRLFELRFSHSPGTKRVWTATRPKNRLRRLLFFKFRCPTLPVPYRGAESYLWPIAGHRAFDLSAVSWRPGPIPSVFQNWLNSANEGPLIALAPSAAWPNKRWPTDRWQQLVVAILQQRPKARFVLLGGPDDGFLHIIGTQHPATTVFDGVGRLTLLESASILSKCDLLIANDTGLLHVADRLQKSLIAIIGPTAFGYPVNPRARVAEVDRRNLPCKPCSKDGRDPCRNREHLKCMNEISVTHVLNLALESLA